MTGSATILPPMTGVVHCARLAAMHPHRPHAPGYPANRVASLFHEVSAQRLDSPGIRAEQFQF
jgi:hypothetical protein